METLETDKIEGAVVAPVVTDEAPQSVVKMWTSRVGWGLVGLFVLWLLITQSKARSTLLLVLGAVIISGGLWIGANLIFDQARKDWKRFNALLYGVVGFCLGAIISGNRLVNGSGGGDGRIGRFGSWVWLGLVVAVALGAVGLMLARTEDEKSRLIIGAAGVGAVGALIGALLKSEVRPEVDIAALAVWTIAVAAVGAGISLARKQSPVGGAMIGGAAGWFLGAFGSPDLGTGSTAWALIAAAVPAAVLGARIAMKPNGGVARQVEVDRRSRAVIFLAPALAFLTVMLIVPTIRTLLLSFKGRDSVEYVGLDNYTQTFKDPNSWDHSNWANMFISWPMAIGLVLLAIFVVIGATMKKRTGHIVELGSPSMGPLVIGGIFVAFAVFTALRGTIINNLWWVVVVTLFSTGLGLAVAVLADGVRFEKAAKSIIFMPMAISLVGASVIWRFMYIARDASKEQTGVMNGLWVGLGKLSTGTQIASTVLVAVIALIGLGVILRSLSKRNYAMAGAAVIVTPALLFAISWVWAQASGDVQRIVVGLVLSAIFLGVVVFGGRSVMNREYGQAVVPLVGALLLGWFLIRFWGIAGGGVGGQKTSTAGETVAGPIFFIQESPYNNLFLMFVLIWIQTGFAMVILSAAIKAVPTEIIEAARVDGATTTQVFWRVTLPQIAPTIGVVITTIIVLVMKVFDIVKVMTNSIFGTQVLANDMFNQAFNIRDTGRGAALAIFIFISVLPVMVLNIRRMQQEN